MRNHEITSSTLFKLLAVAPLALSATLFACTTTTSTTASEPSPLTEADSGAPASDNGDVTPDAGSPSSSTATCPLTPDTTTSCGSCFKSKCEKSCNTCAGDAACDVALVCVMNCTTDACIAACVSGLSTASMDKLDAVIGDDGCVYTTCGAECKTPGKVGDPCTADSDCASGSCNGSWCGSSCSVNTDCGIDTAGQLVWCVEDSADQDTCFPGCESNADCASYPGTTCKSVTATNGGTGTICSL